MAEESPFDLPDAGENEGDGAPVETSTMQDLRKYAKRLEKESKALQDELAELREFRGTVTKERRDNALTAAFTEVGLNPAHAKLFTALNPEVGIEEINADSVAKFAAEFGLPAQSTGEVPAAPEPRQEGYVPVTTGQAPPLAKYSQDDIDQMFREGRHDEVMEAYRTGRVQRETL